MNKSLFGFIRNIFSYEFRFNCDRATYIVTILGIKIKHVVDKPLLNKGICKKMGIKTLVFVRGDGIGDFIFNRPYLKYIKQSEKYKNYKIILAGTPQIVAIAKKFDKQYIDSYIQLDFTYKEIEEKIKSIKNFYADILINPIDAKFNSAVETFAKNIKAGQKIGHYGFFSRFDMIKDKERMENILSKYTEVIDSGENLMHVSERCKIFFELLLGENLPLPLLLKDIPNVDIDVKSDYIVISPFSRSKIRTYSKENFVAIIDYITGELKIPVMIIGSNSERKKAQAIKGMCKYPEMVYNKAGISLNEVILYLRMAKMLVANETGTVHIAQNYRVKTVCISNGSYMHTWQPYPQKESCVEYVYPENIEEYIEENNLDGQLLEYDINVIPPKAVIDKINNVMSGLDSALACC